MSGTDLKDSFAALSGTIFVVDDDPDLRRLLLAGFLQKPCTASELTERLLEALEGERKTA